MGNIFSVKDACATLLVLRFRRTPSPSAFLYPVYIYIYTSVLRYIHVIRAVGVGVTLKTGDTSEDNLSRKDIELIRVIFQPSTSTFSSPSFLNFIPPSLLHHVAAPPTNLETILKSAFEEGSFEKGARKRGKKRREGKFESRSKGKGLTRQQAKVRGPREHSN